jgi:hypothetical protein
MNRKISGHTPVFWKTKDGILKMQLFYASSIEKFIVLRVFVEKFLSDIYLYQVDTKSDCTQNSVGNSIAATTDGLFRMQAVSIVPQQ